MQQIIISGDWHKLVSDWQEVMMSSLWKNLALQYHLLPSGEGGWGKSAKYCKPGTKAKHARKQQ